MAFLEMKHVSKRFGKVVANEDVSLSVEQGEIHALLGENGAGKSTLMNILYGLYKPTSGEVYMKGERLDIKDPSDAIAKGIGMVHQHFMLIPALSVIENVVLGLKSNKTVLDLKASAGQFAAMAESYGMPVDPWAKVSSLSVGEQQRVEILKALFRKANLLILDEPTAVLTPQEVTALFEVIRRLTAEGLTIIIISHKMHEIMAVCHRCTVLRQGRVAATLSVSEIRDVSQLAELMVGQRIKLEMDKQPARPGGEVLRVQSLGFRGKDGVDKLKDVSFTVRAGEIVSICGVDGNGQSELIRCMTGLLRATCGTVTLHGEDITHAPTRSILDKGVSHIPEDRQTMGMLADMSVNENLILTSFHSRPFSRRGMLNLRWIKERNEQLIETFNVKTPDIYERAGNLSGGNQQKFVVGRELDRAPSLLIAVHPDRGLDIGATKFIQQRLLDERDKGVAVLLVSTELDEILELSDRIVVISHGEIMGVVDQAEATRERLGLMMAGVREAVAVSG